MPQLHRKGDTVARVPKIDSLPGAPSIDEPSLADPAKPTLWTFSHLIYSAITLLQNVTAQIVDHVQHLVPSVAASNPADLQRETNSTAPALPVAAVRTRGDPVARIPAKAA
ncbi:hypothetical protein FRC01_010061 [Tulasnella sp. 417]|nr:hypothetical protein FRC01_010061 [Tulasnella sp. 417]